MSKKVVYNNCHGGFALSKLAAIWLAGKGHKESIEWLGDIASKGDAWNETFYPFTMARHSSLLVECVETLGRKANGTFSELKIAEVKDLYRVEEYDGLETVITPESARQWASAINDPEEKTSLGRFRDDDNT